MAGAYTGVASPFKYGAGVYPGAGVAAGGRQGRAAIMHGGVGGTARSLVSATKGSQRMPARTAAAALPRVESNHALPGATGGTVTSGSGGSLVGPISLIPPRPDNHGPVTGAKPPVAPPPPPFDPSVYQDSEYWTQWTDEQTQRQLGENGTNALQALIAGLQSRFNGLTPYEVQANEARRKWMNGLRGERARAGASGLTRSGWRRMMERDKASEWESSDAELYRTVGQGRVDNLNQQINDHKANLLLAKQRLEMAAAQRYKERLSKEAAQTFNTQFMSYFNNPANWQAG